MIAGSNWFNLMFGYCQGSSLKTNFHVAHSSWIKIFDQKWTHSKLKITKRNMWFSQIRNGFGLRFGQIAIFRMLCQKHEVFPNLISSLFVAVIWIRYFGWKFFIETQQPLKLIAACCPNARLYDQLCIRNELWVKTEVCRPCWIVPPDAVIFICTRKKMHLIKLVNRLSDN